MNPRRVLMTTDTVGGVWHYALELARGLGECGVEIALASLGEPAPAERRAAEQIPGVTLYSRRCKLEWMRDPWADLDGAGDWLLQLAAALRPDVVHLNHYCHGALPWRAPVLVAAHSCVYSWFEAVHGGAPGASWQRYYEAIKAGLSGADLVVAPSAAMLDAAARFYGPFRARCVIANGRRPSAFPPGAKEARVLTAGRLWDEAKNIGALAAIAALLPWPVRLIGDVRHPDDTSKDRESFANVEWRKPMDAASLAREYAAAAIYALPARYEPFGLSALEAALAGCALVLGDIASLREIWGDAALYVEPDDHAALAAALRRLINDPPERRHRARQARHHALRYGASRMTQAYLSAYRDLLENHHCRRDCPVPAVIPPFPASPAKRPESHLPWSRSGEGRAGGGFLQSADDVVQIRDTPGSA